MGPLSMSYFLIAATPETAPPLRSGTNPLLKVKRYISGSCTWLHLRWRWLQSGGGTHLTSGIFPVAAGREAWPGQSSLMPRPPAGQPAPTPCSIDTFAQKGSDFFTAERRSEVGRQKRISRRLGNKLSQGNANCRMSIYSLRSYFTRTGGTIHCNQLHLFIIHFLKYFLVYFSNKLNKLKWQKQFHQ